jgi:hypothetical protein
MHAAQLKLLLAKGSIVSDNLRDAVSLCETWYRAEPSLATFTLYAIFSDLAARGWADQQGAPTASYQLFQAGVLPHLATIASILSATPAAEPITDLDVLVVAYRDFLRAIP